MKYDHDLLHVSCMCEITCATICGRPHTASCYPQPLSAAMNSAFRARLAVLTLQKPKPWQAEGGAWIMAKFRQIG